MPPAPEAEGFANDVDPVELPENAFRELGADEQYRPLMHPARQYREVTVYSVLMGLVLCIIFSAAAAYLGLKVGQVFEAAIPISIIAVGLSSALNKKNALGQNVIIQSIGSCSGVIVAGAIFTLPALYILQGSYPDIMVDFYQIFLSSLLGRDNHIDRILLGPDRYGEDKACADMQHRRRVARTRIYRGSEICVCHIRGFHIRMVDHNSSARYLWRP